MHVENTQDNWRSSQEWTSQQDDCKLRSWYAQKSFLRWRCRSLVWDQSWSGVRVEIKRCFFFVCVKHCCWNQIVTFHLFFDSRASEIHYQSWYHISLTTMLPLKGTFCKIKINHFSYVLFGCLKLLPTQNPLDITITTLCFVFPRSENI